MNTHKIVITLLVLFSGKTLFAQSKSSWDITTLGGYEYNYFKSPTEIRTNDIILTESDLISSSIYQDVEVKYRYRYKWDKHRIRFSANPFSRIYYENVDDSYWSLDARANYDYKFSKRTRLFVKTKFVRMNREGLGGDQDVLINPLGYTIYGGTVGVELTPFKNNELTVGGFYNFKNFDAFGARDLQFNEYGVQISSVQSFKVDRLEHEIGITGYVKKRLYDTFNASDVDNINIGERDWDYAKGTLFYTLPFSKNFELRPEFSYYVRIDNSTNRSGFNQLGPGIRAKYDNKKTKIRTSLSYITRNYTDIQARNTDGEIGEKLKYGYTNFEINGAREIGGGFSITGTIYSKIRSTNYTDIDARSFRNYRNQYAGIGVLWEF
ncbi:hypothetical protein [Aquimarina sp. 2201CG5-10]|uniref:hypothetical protein n=1 Tax=Aquimarina callyspongiae TaxID=3098150 RepID=UPI002AB3FC28|nr:hypothetical protein [Aquimarina sp. 2201CG5-10]MDY8137194.1 hypothetical protein [Aquimarina sp. 2201CG5-10]